MMQTYRLRAFPLLLAVTVFCTHGISILIGLIHRSKAGKLVLRGAGALIMMGCVFLYQALA